MGKIKRLETHTPHTLEIAKDGNVFVVRHRFGGLAINRVDYGNDKAWKQALVEEIEAILTVWIGGNE